MVITQKAIENDYYIKRTINLLDSLDIKYKNIELYINSFIHRSIVNEKPDFTPKHNERLEFLWDAVLELVITENLFNDYSKKTEWELTDMRSAIVRWSNLAKIALELWLEEHLLLWKWEELSWWRSNNYLLANLVEAFLWAIYLDLGFTKATIFVNNHIYPSLKKINENNSFKDYKTLIQELIQSSSEITPHYEVISESWPDHDKIFIVWIYLDKKLIWEGKGSSKKKAQEKAAENWYNKLSNK